MIDVGERLKELMEARGLNMHSLAKRSGLSWNTIKNFYTRKSIPTVTTISMLCDGLGITLAQFFDAEQLGVMGFSAGGHLAACVSNLAPAETKPAFSILTRDPAESISFIHHRMPVILPREAVRDWLNTSYRAEEVLQSAVLNVSHRMA